MKSNETIYETTINDLTHDGRGVGLRDGKTVFISGALPSETVTYRIRQRKRKHEEAEVVEVLQASDQRVEPGCASYRLCGGCALQHLSAEGQIEYKQNGLLNNFRKIGKVEPQVVLPSLTASVWGYRSKARLGVRYVHKKEKVLVGFREKFSHFLAEIDSCPVLDARVGEHLLEIGDAIRQTSAHREIPQIEVAVAENAVAMIFRHLKPLNHADQQVLIELGQKLNYQIFLQPKGPNTVHCIWPSQTPDQLKYHLNDFGLQLNFRATDFTQVNTAINQQMVKRAVEFLQLDGSETVLDLFCGLGNFSLPIARQAKHVIGVEGEQAMVERASDNAKLNNIENVEFHTANLFEDFSALPWVKPVDKMLIDPPRSGAIQIAEQIKRFKPKLIVYVSCDPATLARDAGELVNNQGYKLMKAGVMDMFPHTTHVESIAVFEK